MANAAPSAAPAGKTTQTVDMRAGRREEFQAMSDEQPSAELAAMRERLALEPGHIERGRAVAGPRPGG